jgi:hypothetical protein
MKLVNKLTQQRKGQLTMFMLVGVVVLLIFVFVFFALNSLTEARMRGRIERTKAPALTAPIIQFYVGDCLKDVFKEGLIKIGLQGGYFYEGQAGYIYSSGYKLPYTNFRGENISYLVYPTYDPFGDAAADYNLGWPCKTDENAPSYCRFKRNETDAKYFDFVSDLEKAARIYSDGYSKFRFPNIQKQVEQYIKNKTAECINFSAVAENFPGYEITFEEPEPHVSLGVKSTSVQLNYPIKLKFQDYEPVIVIQEFQTELPVRFRTISSIILKLLKSEINDIDFDPSTEIDEIIEDTSITLSVENLSDSIFDEVYIINDSLSVLGNKNYIFQFARRNRPPVLNYISKSPSYLYNPADTSKDIYDYLTIPVSGLDTIVATINATDPDEDLAIVYSSESDTIPELNLLNIIPLSTFTINKSHIGYHNVTIRASDGEFTDVQRVRLLVDPILEPKANLVNIYGTDIYSPEDPCFLNATPTMESFDSFATYIFGWDDKKIIEIDNKLELIGLYLNISYPCLALPSGNKCSDAVFDITNMFGLVLPLDSSEAILRVNLSYSEISQNTEGVVSITKQACIPHRNQNSPSYPYNKPSGVSLDEFGKTKEAFLGDHSCCNDDGTIKGTNAVCYQEEECVGSHLNYYTRTHYCDGVRGNICGGDNISLEPTNKCGCSLGWINSHSDCQTQFQYTGSGWCYGQDGCADVCKESLWPGDEAAVRNQDGIIYCNCNSNYNDLQCDNDFDGNFDGVCEGNKCQGDD